MANLQKTKSEALAIIDAALAILNKFPEIETADSTLSFNTSSNPFPFLMDCFKSTTGYNILIKILSKFIMLGLPAVEIAVKGILKIYYLVQLILLFRTKYLKMVLYLIYNKLI